MSLYRNQLPRVQGSAHSMCVPWLCSLDAQGQAVIGICSICVLSPGCADAVPNPCPHVVVPLRGHLSHLLFLEGRSPIASGPTLVTVSDLNSLCKAPSPHTGTFWGPGGAGVNI